MTVEMNHDALLDLVAAYALGSVSAEEARIVSAHIAVCDECRAEYRALRPAANAVGLSAEDPKLDAAPGDRMKQRVLQSIAAETPVVRKLPRRPSLVTVLALAAALVLAFVSIDASRRLNAAQTEFAQDRTIVADLQAAGAQSYDVPEGQILKTADRIYIVMRSLPPPPKGRVYQAWTLAPGAKTVAPSVTFVPDSHGFVVVSLPEAAPSVAAVAVSVEPPGGSRAPTTKPTFVRPLT